MLTLIIGCEIAFWVLLAAGLATRYLLRAQTLSTVLLIAVPLVDVALLIAAAVDLRSGGAATASHGLAAVYIGGSVAFGHQLVGWADRQFTHRFLGGPPLPGPPRTGPAHAAYERRQWLRHLLAYLTAVVVLGLFTVLVGGAVDLRPMWQVLVPWAVVLGIDFLISFSYTLAPRKAGR